jgi:hypothetical protein
VCVYVDAQLVDGGCGDVKLGRAKQDEWPGICLDGLEATGW